MDYGAIIKRSWQITWRYKALWVLGIFAGVSGCAGGGGGGNGGGSSNWSEGSGGSTPDTAALERFWERMGDYLPLIIGVSVLLIFISLLWSVLTIAARGGLVTGVNSVEEQGGQPPLGDLWRAGFGRFWSLVGLDIMLKLPVFAVLMLMLVVMFVPLAGTLIAGQEPGPESLVPLCGSLVIGLPILMVGGTVLDIMFLLAVRYVMLGGQGAVQAVGNSWRFFRARFKDTALMYLINAGLNLAASMALGIPVIILTLVFVVPIITAGVTEAWGVMVAVIGFFVIVLTAVSVLYNGVWGTYTSSLWTLFFRMVAGMAAQPVAVTAGPAPYEPPVATSPPADLDPTPVVDA